MKEISIKLSYLKENNNKRSLKQTPNYSGKWGNCKFYFNEKLKKYDYWIIRGDLQQTETKICPKENTILLTSEPTSLLQYNSKFTNQFDTIISCHEYIKHKNKISLTGASRFWRFDKSYDELSSIKKIKKTKLISLVISNKNFSLGHNQRIQFRQILEKHFGHKIDFFGRGFKEVKDKWEALAPYKYHIAIENSQFNNYWTEKLTDSFLALCYPIYCGAPNINDYFDKNMLTAIDITKPEKAIKTIEKIINSNIYEKSLAHLKKAQNKCLNKYNFFAFISNLIKEKEANKKKEYIYNKITLTKMPHYGILGSLVTKQTLEIEIKFINKILKQSSSLDKKTILKNFYNNLCRKAGIKGKLFFIKNFGIKNYLKVKTW